MEKEIVVSQVKAMITKKEAKPKKAPKKKEAKKAAAKKSTALVRAGSKAIVKKKDADDERSVTKGYLQSDRIKLDEGDLNDNEKKLLSAIRKHKSPIDVQTLAKEVFSGTKAPDSQVIGKKRKRGKELPGGYRRVLNSLRRLVSARFVKRESRGQYARA